MNIYIYNIIWIYWIYLNIFEYIEYLISPSLPSGRYCSAMSVSTSGGRWPVALWLFSQWEAPDEALMDAALQARSWIKHGSTWCNDLGELIVDDIYIYRLVYHGISYGTQNERNNMIHRETNFELQTDSLLRGFFWGLATSRGLLGSRYTFAAECPGTCMSCTRKNIKNKTM